MEYKSGGALDHHGLAGLPEVRSVQWSPAEGQTCNLLRMEGNSAQVREVRRFMR